MRFLGVNLEYTIIVEVDNQEAIFLAQNEASSQRTKHIDTKYLFIQEYVEDGIVKIIFVKSKENDSNILTKYVRQVLFHKHINKFMIEDKWNWF